MVLCSILKTCCKNKNSKCLLTNNELNIISSRSFRENEERRISQIKELLSHGKEELALRHLLSDIEEECNLQYFNQLRYANEDGFVVDVIETVSNSKLPRKETKVEIENDTCSWKGLSRNGKPIICSSTAVRHPWRTFETSDGITELVKTKFCMYHQKLCLNESKLHQDDLPHVLIPNQYGLCNECYFLKEGSAPPNHTLVKSFVADQLGTLENKKYSLKLSHNAFIQNGKNKLIENEAARKIQLFMKYFCYFLSTKKRYLKRFYAVTEINRFARGFIVRSRIKQYNEHIQRNYN